MKKIGHNSLLDDLNNLEFRVFIYYYSLKFSKEDIAHRLHLDLVEVRQILKFIKCLREFDVLKDDIAEAFIGADVV